MRTARFFILTISLSFAATLVFAQGADIISYPVKELGSCDSREDCQSYCDKFENLEQCYNFSRDHNLVSSCQLIEAGKLLSAFKLGVNILPCRGVSECREYCLDENNFEQCTDFVEQTGFITHKKALLLKKTKGIGPGECKSKEECRIYCDDENNLDECLAFALEHGFFTQEQVARSIKVRDLADKGGPGECKGLKECAGYCSDSANLDQCIQFARENGLIQEEEIDKVEEFAKEGGPGGCKTREECASYCSDSLNNKECLGFMIDNNFLNDETVEIFEKQLDESRNVFESQLDRLNEDQRKKALEQFDKQIEPFRKMINNYKENNLPVE